MDVPTIFRHPLVLGREGGNWEREERQVMDEDKSFMALAVVVRHSQTEERACDICSRAIGNRIAWRVFTAIHRHHLAPIPHQ